MLGKSLPPCPHPAGAFFPYCCGAHIIHVPCLEPSCACADVCPVQLLVAHLYSLGTCSGWKSAFCAFWPLALLPKPSNCCSAALSNMLKAMFILILAALVVNLVCASMPIGGRGFRLPWTAAPRRHSVQRCDA